MATPKPISAKADATLATASKTVLQVGVELIGVGIVSFAAGTNDELGKVIVWIMLGLWVIWIMNNPSVQLAVKGYYERGTAAFALGQAAKGVQL